MGAEEKADRRAPSNLVKIASASEGPCLKINKQTGDVIEGDILMSISDSQGARMRKCSLPPTHIYPIHPCPPKEVNIRISTEAWEREEGF